MPTALALSPHLDDAAFSSGGLIATLAGRGWRVVVATLFTVSVPNPTGFALACQLDKGLSAAVDYMALRREEDRAAMQALGAEPPVWLPFAEAPHRGYGSASALFGEVAADDMLPALGAALSGLLARTAPELLLLPQAVGGHVDHVQLVRALDQLRPAAPILWWRDFPYTVRDATSKQPLRQRMEALPERALQLGAEAERRKRAACQAYASQVGFQFGGTAGLDARLDAERRVERFRLQRKPGGEAAIEPLFAPGPT